MGENLILTTYFTSCLIPGSKKKYISDNFSSIERFYKSIQKHNLECIIFHDNYSNEFIDKYQTDKILFYRVNTPIRNAIDSRWSIYEEYLKNDKNIKYLFCLDITDIEVIKNPFKDIKRDKIYCGSEPSINGTNDWMIDRYNQIKDYISYDNYKNNQVLNAGIVGGEKTIIQNLITQMSRYLDKTMTPEISIDMNIFNHVIYSNFVDKFITGHKIHSRWRKYERWNTWSLFRHK